MSFMRIYRPFTGLRFGIEAQGVVYFLQLYYSIKKHIRFMYRCICDVQSEQRREEKILKVTVELV